MPFRRRFMKCFHRCRTGCNGGYREAEKNHALFFQAGWRKLKCAVLRRVFVMQTETKKVFQFFKSWLISTFAVLVAVQVVHGIHFRDPGLLAPVLTALVLGILNAFIRPILVIFALPLLILTLGLFMLVINALMLCFVSWLMQPYFRVDTFGGHPRRTDHQPHVWRAERPDRQLERAHHGSAPSAAQQAGQRWQWSGD